MTFALNPCAITFYDCNVNYNRKIIVLLMIVEMTLLLLLKMVTVTCQKRKKNKVEEAAKGERPLDENEIKIQNLEHLEKEIGWDQLNSYFSRKMPKDKKQQRYIQSSLTQPKKLSSSQKQQIHSDNEMSINIKHLRISLLQLSTIVNYLVGHHFIALSLAFLYFPYSYSLILAFLQLVITLALTALRICYSDGSNLFKILSGIAMCLNIMILSLGIYGLSSRVPDIRGNLCLGF